MNDVNSVWYATVYDVLISPHHRVSVRDMATYERLGDLRTINMRRPILTQAERRISYPFMFAEAAWVLDGDDRVEPIVPYAPSVARYSDDGERFFGAYGPRFTQQVGAVVDKLVADPRTRQAVIQVWRVNPPCTRDVPCTLTMQFVARDGALDTFVNMRSSDVWLGLPYDVFTATMATLFVAQTLRERGARYELGTLYQYASSRHLYERNAPRARTALANRTYDVDYDDLSALRCGLRPADIAPHLWALARGERTGLRSDLFTELMGEV